LRWLLGFVALRELLKTLYFTSRNHLGAVTVKIPGIPVPVQKKT
jgi:hypothetical protein